VSRLTGAERKIGCSGFGGQKSPVSLSGSRKPGTKPPEAEVFSIKYRSIFDSSGSRISTPELIVYTMC